MPPHNLVIYSQPPGQIEILEWPGGDATKIRVYLGPQLLGSDRDQEVVTLRFADLSHNGRLDLIITVGNLQSAMINDQGTLRAPTPTEQQLLLQNLQQPSP